MRCADCGRENPDDARFCNACGTDLARLAAEEQPENVDDGRYVLRRLLGEGARKRVYLAADTRLGRDVALALVKVDDLDDAGRVRVEREARAMARLGDHPHVVTVHDVGTDDGRPFIVSQLMPGGSLADRLGDAEGHRLDIEAALRVAQDVALALEHAHGHGVVHRDVKPGNVWLSAEGRALLGDFGLAVMADHSRLTGEGMVVGTVAYLAPEQALGRAPDPRADLYSLGAVLYEMLTGRPPFLGDDAVAVISQHVNTAPVVPSWHRADVPATAEALVLRLLAKNPADRPASAADVVTALRALRESSIEMVAAPAPEPPAAGRRADWGRFVGRVEQMSEVRAAFDDAAAGRGGLLMVVGEPGIGKTRLAEELATYATVRGAQPCWGHCYEGEVGVPYLPFVEALRSYTRARPDAELRSELGSGAPEVATLVSELRERFPDLPPSPELDPDEERLRLFDGVTTFLRNASRTQPILLLLDDLHWADKPTLLLLQYPARNVRRERVLLIGTYRDVELDRTHPLGDVVASLRRDDLYRRVLLRGMAEDEVGALISAIGGQDVDAPIVSAVFRETEGNPFFVREMLRHLAESGLIRRDEGRWVGDPAEVARLLPEGIREVIGRRLSHLSEPCNRMLAVASAMPGGFSLGVVAAAMETKEDELLDPLDEALGAQVVRERAERVATYEFTHALIRQTLYGELSAPRRVRLHRQIAGALEDVSSQHVDAVLGELAYHWFQAAPAGDVDKAIGYARRAAARSIGQAAFEEAARYLDMALQALEFAPAPDDAARCDLLIDFGEAHQRAGELSRARGPLLEAADLARALDDSERLARAAITLASFRAPTFGGDRELLGLLEEATDRKLTDGLRARVLLSLAAHVVLADDARFRALQDEIEALARAAGELGVLSSVVRFAMMRSDFTRAEFGQRVAQGLEVMRLAQQSRGANAAASVLAAHHSLLAVALEFGDRALHDEHLAGTTRLAAEIRSPGQTAIALLIRARTAIMEGRFDDADRFIDEYLAYAQRAGVAQQVATAAVVAFPLQRERGALAAAELATRRATERFPTVTAYRAGLVLLLAELGRLDEARGQVATLAADDFAGIADDGARVFTLALIAEVVARLGEPAWAARLYELLRPSEGLGVLLLAQGSFWGATDRFLGVLAGALGHHDQALAHLDAANDMHERMLARPWVARTQYDRACVLAARGAPGDPAAAVALANRALATANELGMTRLVEETLALKLALQGVELSSVSASIDAVTAAVSLQRPDLRPHAAADGWVTIAFSDVEGYTSLTERLGDTRTQHILRAHHEIVRATLADHHGTEVKSQGDGFMLAFTHTADALGWAIAVQRAIATHDFGSDAGTLRVRIGIHAGEVVREADDFYGRTVIIASRVAAAAHGGQTLVTGAVRSAVGPDRFGFDAGRDLALKGLGGTTRAYAVQPHSDT